MSKKKSRSPKSGKADKMLNEASKRLHKEWKRTRLSEPSWTPPEYPSPKWKRGYYGSQEHRWGEVMRPKRTWYVQTKQQGDPNVRIGFSITFAAIVLIVTKMLFF